MVKATCQGFSRTQKVNSYHLKFVIHWERLVNFIMLPWKLKKHLETKPPFILKIFGSIQMTAEFKPEVARMFVLLCENAEFTVKKKMNLMSDDKRNYCIEVTRGLV